MLQKWPGNGCSCVGMGLQYGGLCMVAKQTILHLRKERNGELLCSLVISQVTVMRTQKSRGKPRSELNVALHTLYMSPQCWIPKMDSSSGLLPARVPKGRGTGNALSLPSAAPCSTPALWAGACRAWGRLHSGLTPHHAWHERNINRKHEATGSSTTEVSLFIEALFLILLSLCLVSGKSV